MNEVTSRACVREQIGVAVNASSLVMRAEGGETPLLRIAALGAAAAVIAAGQDRDDNPLASSLADVRPVKEQDHIEAELAPILWHLRYGQQHAEIERAVALFALWLAKKERMSDKRARLGVFAARVLHEWLSDRCIACGGSGKLERLRNGNLIRARGSMQRNAVFAPCRACGGSGRAMPSATERERCLDIDHATYVAQDWDKSFTLALTWVDAVARRLRRPLTAELGRRKRHADRA